MASLMEEFISVLEQENLKYQELVELSQAKTQTIVYAKIEELQEVTAGEQDVLEQLQKLENKRMQVRKDMADVLNLHPDQLTLLHMAEMFSNKPSEQKKILDLRERLRLTLVEVAKINTENETLLRQAMEMLDFDMTLVKSMRQAPTTANYNKSAYSTEVILPSSGFDAKQ
ncbi:MAG: flagellar protein FlgN [Lachnospiraceae bacterium]